MGVESLELDYCTFEVESWYYDWLYQLLSELRA